MEKRATQPNNIRKSRPYKPNKQTPKVPSQPSPTTKAKNRVKNHTQNTSTPKRAKIQKT